MSPTVTFLFSIGLCLDWMTRVQMDSLPRPTLWALPGSVVSKGADVTLRCQGHLEHDRFQLWVDGKLREERNASLERAEFLLKSVDDIRDARSYRCLSGQGSWLSELSEPLTLVVIGNFPTPSIAASPGSILSPGTEVTITCQISPKPYSQDYSFALLEAKSLEPLQLQKNAGAKAEFSLMSVRAEDTGSYRCIYYKNTAPHLGSLPSKTLDLTVTGPLPKPTLWAQPGLIMAPGANVTLWCSRPKLSALGEVTFTLRKAGTQESFQPQTSANLWTSFLLPSVKPEDTGSYSCAYKKKINPSRVSESSDVLELVVPGSLPRPSLLASPGFRVDPGMHVILQCRLPAQTFLWRVTFTLLKVGSPLPLQSQSPVGNHADFPLLSVGAQDVGGYSCVYYERMAPHRVSEASEALEIWVKGAGPKPSLSVWPGPEVASGADVTVLCRGPSGNRSFVLYKERDEKTLTRMDTIQDGVRFFLTHVTPKDSGNYSCGYQIRANGSFWTQLSDPLQLIVQGSMSNNHLIITLSCVSLLLLLFLFCLLLLWQRSSPKVSFQGDSKSRCLCCLCHPLNTCLSLHAEEPKEEVLNSEVTKERSRQPLVPMAEEPQGMTYAQLNINMLSERKTGLTKTFPEPNIYATVVKD